MYRDPGGRFGAGFVRYFASLLAHLESDILNSLLPRSLAFLLVLAPIALRAEQTAGLTIADSMTHLRSTADREWDWFPAEAESAVLERLFTSSANDTEWTITLRQQNVKQSWEVRLNDRLIGRLVRDENDMRVDFAVPVGSVRDGKNTLEIRQRGEEPDDIQVGQVRLHRAPVRQWRNQAQIKVAVVDSSGNPTPARITVLNNDGTLMPVGTADDPSLAVRQGVVYTLTGEATLGVAPGRYRLIAGRGFEYSIDEATVQLAEGDSIDRSLAIRREVETDGWVACDTHVHTVTHSGHGDCTIEERMVTLAGEGIELPIATDHNKAIDYRPVAKALNATPYFTPVVGDECTTKKGHFNIFPLRVGAKLPNHNQEAWGPLLSEIFSTPDVRVAILNHARDIHSGFRPFSPTHQVAMTGENLDGRPMDFNAMEICNSGAVQTDALQLFHDWCGLTNRGRAITPIGSSDSHDVARFIVGQGRTYLRCDDSSPGRIDTDQAIDALVAGRVIVSYGLMVRLTVNQIAQAGDRLSAEDAGEELIVTAEVHGPAWTRADSVALYVCGRQWDRKTVTESSKPNGSLKARVTWKIPRSQYKHDLWLSAVALGPGIKDLYWNTALPYQPTSKSFTPYVFSATGPIWIDRDGDGEFTSPYGYAQRLVDASDDGATSLQPPLLTRLKDVHPSVIHQVASLLRSSGVELDQAIKMADEPVGTAISEYQRAFRRSVIARLEGQP